MGKGGKSKYYFNKDRKEGLIYILYYWHLYYPIKCNSWK